MTKSYTAKITEAGIVEIERLLTLAGRDPEACNIDAWVREIEDSLEEDAACGNTREHEMRGLRYPTGQTMFFDGEDLELVEYTVEEIED